MPCSPGCLRTHNVDQADLECTEIFLSTGIKVCTTTRSNVFLFVCFNSRFYYVTYFTIKHLKQIAEHSVLYFKFKMWRPIFCIGQVTKPCLEMHGPDLRGLALGCRQDETREHAWGHPVEPRNRKLFHCFLCICFTSLTVPPDLTSQRTWEKVFTPITDKGSIALHPSSRKQRHS